MGPGFDVIGLALSIWLELRVEICQAEKSDALLNCVITYEGEGEGDVPLRLIEISSSVLHSMSYDVIDNLLFQWRPGCVS